jgi:hypothetical protein
VSSLTLRDLAEQHFFGYPWNIYLFIYFVVLGFELRAYTLSHSTSHFIVLVFFKIGSGELFAWAGFKL